ncbi:GTP pyrophosphokinase [Undibacterium amnicola]|uniref:GTP pyrophosphokinase n=1 Tax=Undibacterium amnicola TaxID=1834038 RepID=A0ABR6XS48_9BURK|nr:GTP pyrophosphokinase [Undibacterium amnicola]MBC3832295.1 GTP pyrophosphokinase [Undibacterium amnicola]
MSTLATAIEFATRAHAGRVGEDGDPEIFHSMRVMLRLQDELERQTAIIEDAGKTSDELRAAGFAEEVVLAIETLTGRTGETYDAYIQRVIQHPLATRVKQADVAEHASVVSKMPVNDEQIARMGNYQRARATLAAAMRSF